uniref:Uncharacterized protein n=1 Tax=Pyxicephalus adspersus TaxID=30357 RepID=A0AAV3A5J0_PYXAD|nr:TPA: hypothetical protein GDO54_012162 [Pyxicephalus adspersus]
MSSVRDLSSCLTIHYLFSRLHGLISIYAFNLHNIFHVSIILTANKTECTRTLKLVGSAPAILHSLKTDYNRYYLNVSSDISSTQI